MIEFQATIHDQSGAGHLVLRPEAEVWESLHATIGESGDGLYSSLGAFIVELKTSAERVPSFARQAEVVWLDERFSDCYVHRNRNIRVTYTGLQESASIQGYINLVQGAAASLAGHLGSTVSVCLIAGADMDVYVVLPG